MMLVGLSDYTLGGLNIVALSGYILGDPSTKSGKQKRGGSENTQPLSEIN